MSIWSRGAVQNISSLISGYIRIPMLVGLFVIIVWTAIDNFRELHVVIVRFVLCTKVLYGLWLALAIVN